MWRGLLWSHERSARSEKLEGWVGFGTLATREKIEKFGSKQQPNSNILAHEEVLVGAGDEGHGGVPDKPSEEKKTDTKQRGYSTQSHSFARVQRVIRHVDL